MGEQSRILHTVVAFGNTSGGIIVIGVKDGTKEVVGVKDALEEELRLSNSIADAIYPLIFPEILIHTLNGKELLVVKVAHGLGPYFIKSSGMKKGVYVRLGSTNRVADEQTLIELKRLTTRETFDESPVFDSTIDDIDIESAKKWFKKVGKNFDLRKAEALKCLVNMNSKQFPTVGGVLLFGKRKSEIFPDSVIRCVRFAGTNKAKVLDHQEFEENLPDVLDLAIKFVNRNTSIRSKFGKLIREDIPEYPPKAMRECITNALLHADYSIKGSSIMIAIFDDRIEITNPGAIPFGLTMEKALGGYSQLRNRVIGRIFKELDLIEQWGSGLGRIIKDCKQHGIIQPKIEESGHFFRCTLYNEKEEQAILDSWEDILIDYLKKNEKILAKDLPSLWNISSKTARIRAKKMVSDGKLIEFSSGRFDPTKWYSLSES